MEIKLHQIKIKDLVKGFVDNEEAGVWSLEGKLNIRPPYQRNFVYKNEQENLVINSIMNNFPLNVMYWAKTPNGYEVLDGQQRTLSICYYYNGDKAYESKNFEKPMYFHSLPKDWQEKFLNYELTIYICDGADSEKLKWFEIINIAGATLTKQELRNAVYSGPWTLEAKKYFSKINGAGQNLSKDFISGDVNRQDLLEAAIKWISYQDGSSIEKYMSKHQFDNDAEEIWKYFQNVIHWVRTTFIKTRKEMKSVDWGLLYLKHKKDNLNPKNIEEQIKKYMEDSEIRNKKGIYYYVLSPDLKYLELRTFDNNQKTSAYEKQNGMCLICKKYFKFEEMDGDHIIPWIDGGRTIDENLQMLCKSCNRSKGAK